MTYLITCCQKTQTKNLASHYCYANMLRRSGALRYLYSTIQILQESVSDYFESTESLIQFSRLRFYFLFLNQLEERVILNHCAMTMTLKCLACQPGCSTGCEFVQSCLILITSRAFPQKINLEQQNPRQFLTHIFFWQEWRANNNNNQYNSNNNNNDDVKN